MMDITERLKMNKILLNAIKDEKRENLGKRFKKWIEAQWDYERGSLDKWRVSEERAIREISEAILLDPNNRYFTYNENKLISSYVDFPFIYVLDIDVSVFKELLRDCRLNELGI